MGEEYHEPVAYYEPCATELVTHGRTIVPYKSCSNHSMQLSSRVRAADLNSHAVQTSRFAYDAHIPSHLSALNAADGRIVLFATS